MLNEIYLDAIRNRDQKLLALKDDNYDRIVAAASSKWVQYDPEPKKCRSAGIDSSWNKRAFQGIDLYAVDAVAVDSCNKILYKKQDNNIGSGRGEKLESAAMLMEAEMARMASGDVDIVCVDGSFTSRLIRSSTEFITEMANTVRNHANIIFISKTSDTKYQFSDLGSKAGDIYYFNRVAKSAGFSRPLEVTERRSNLTITEVYAKLKEATPIIKIEIIRTGVLDSDIKSTLDQISYHSVSGYPYCLKLAHKNCKIGDEDIDRLASIYGLQNEIGARDALNE